MKRSKKAVPEELKNPWIVENLEEFLYYCCPECDVKSKDTQSFIEHALINHAQAQHLVVVKIEEESDEPLNIDGTVVHLIDATESQSVLPEEVEPEDTLETQTIEEEPIKEDIKPKKTDLTTLQCYVCGELNASNSQMTKHIKSQHYPKVKASMYGAPRDHQCSECKLMFQSEDSLGLHTCGQVLPSWTGKTKGQTKQCPDCDMSFKKSYDLLRHKAVKHSKEKNFACDQCDYKASLPTLLKKHQRRVHSENRERKHLCNLCGSMFMEKTQLWSHISYIHGKSLEESMCYSCGVVIKTGVGMTKHLKEVHNREVNRTDVNIIKCEACDIEFSDLEALRLHFRQDHKHLKNRPKAVARYNCNECDKVFYSKSQLEGHINRSHVKERKYPCTRCSAAFYDARSLKVHNDGHDGVNQHKCTTCGKEFKTKYLCERHVKTVHEKTELYMCQTCSFKTFHAYSLTAHIQQVHQKYRPHKCDICDDAFFYRRDKEKHMTRAHGAHVNAEESVQLV